MRLLIATNSRHKAREIREILGTCFDELVTLKDAGLAINVVEDGETFLDNALKKARQVQAASGAQAVLSDDSGLAVDALSGAPGVYSARFAGEGHDDQANNQELLRRMEAVPAGQRGCRFVCAVALVLADGRIVTAQGACPGELLFAPRGEGGFGYDPLFYYPPLQKSFAQLSSEEKNQVSHRRRALNALRAQLAP